MSFANLLFSFKGRIARQAFWLVGLYCAPLALLGVIVLRPFTDRTIGLIIFIVWCVLVVWLTSAPCVKRCHDLGRSGWWLLITLIPFVGTVAWFIWGSLVKGNKGSNKYGDDPLQADPRKLSASLSTNTAGKILIAAPVTLMATCLVLRVAGLLLFVAVPGSSSMAPAISKGDHVVMERFTFLVRKPQRGEVVVLTTKGLTGLPENQLWTKRIAGLPGERLRIVDGKLYANGSPVLLTNTQGEIKYLMPFGSGYNDAVASIADKEGVAIPEASYFVLGDNSTNSLDSRFWGFLPAENVVGRVWFCYYPVQRTRLVK